MFEQMYNDRYHKEYFHSLKNVLCSASSFPSPHTLLTPGNHKSLFTVAIVLPFPECHTVGTEQHVVFSD